MLNLLLKNYFYEIKFSLKLTLINVLNINDKSTAEEHYRCF